MRRTFPFTAYAYDSLTRRVGEWVEFPAGGLTCDGVEAHPPASWPPSRDHATFCRRLRAYVRVWEPTAGVYRSRPAAGHGRPGERSEHA